MSLRALADIKEWFAEQGAEAILDNLNEPASEEALAAAEAQLGFAPPPGLKAVYREHDGQREVEMGNQLLPYGIGALLDLRGALQLTSSRLRTIIAPFDAPEVPQSEQDAWEKWIAAPLPTPERMLTPSWFTISRYARQPSQLRPEECSTAWLMFAWQETFAGWVNLRSGRVFNWAKNEGISLEADCIGAFLARFADDLWNEKLALKRDDSYDDSPVEERPWIWRD